MRRQSAVITGFILQYVKTIQMLGCWLINIIPMRKHIISLLSTEIICKLECWSQTLEGELGISAKKREYISTLSTVVSSKEKKVVF